MGFGTGDFAVGSAAIGPQIGLPARHALKTQRGDDALAVPAAGLGVEIDTAVLRTGEQPGDPAEPPDTPALRGQRPPVDRGRYVIGRGEIPRLGMPQVDFVENEGIEPGIIKEKKGNAAKELALFGE